MSTLSVNRIENVQVFDFANTAFVTAFNAANAAYSVSNTAYASVNSNWTVTNTVYGVANAAFNSANNVAPQVAPAYLTANLAYLNSNAAYTTANTKLANTSGVAFAGNLFFPTGNVSIGYTSDQNYKLAINGNFVANTKSFLIAHPTKPNMKLRYASLEGPENGVYLRGKIDGTNVIELPDYWLGLVDLDSISVNLTSIGRAQNLYVAAIDGLRIHIDTENHTQPYCYYHVYAERKDVDKLIVEF